MNTKTTAESRHPRAVARARGDRSGLAQGVGPWRVRPSIPGTGPKATWIPTPGQEADQYGAGQEVGQEAQPEIRRPGAEAPAISAIMPASATHWADREARETSEAGEHDRCRGGVGATTRCRDEPSRAKPAPREQQRVEAGDDRHAGDLGVAHDLGDGQRGQGHAGQHVPAQLGPVHRPHAPAAPASPAPIRPLPSPAPPTSPRPPPIPQSSPAPGPGRGREIRAGPPDFSYVTCALAGALSVHLALAP